MGKFPPRDENFLQTRLSRGSSQSVTKCYKIQPDFKNNSININGEDQNKFLSHQMDIF